MTDYQFRDIATAPIVQDAIDDWNEQQERIAYCQRIIAESPNTPKARNARKLIADIRMQLGY